MTLADMPEMLTVEEARSVLRIGRNAAYELARRYEDTAGREGLPVVRLGRSLRVPRVALERILDLVPPDPTAAAPPFGSTRLVAVGRPEGRP